MAVGYALGAVFTQKRAARAQQLFLLGAAVIFGFVVLRAANLYGDPAPWAIQDSLLATLLSFINCEKYPPSLLYLGMTLGPALVLLAAFERVRGPVAGWISTYGRVPFFYYVVHIFLLHALAVLFAWVTIGDIGWLFGPLAGHKPAAYGLRSPRHLCGMGRGCRSALSALPLVRGNQTPPDRMVVELSLNQFSSRHRLNSNCLIVAIIQMNINCV